MQGHHADHGIIDMDYSTECKYNKDHLIEQSHITQQFTSSMDKVQKRSSKNKHKKMHEL
jgi:hypothetical protein